MMPAQFLARPWTCSRQGQLPDSIPWRCSLRRRYTEFPQKGVPEAGAQYGQGCWRRGAEPRGWSAPVFVQLEAAASDSRLVDRPPTRCCW